MIDYQFWTLAVLMIGSILAPIVAWHKEKEAREVDMEKIATLQTSLNAADKHVSQYLKLLKERQDVELPLQVADRIIKIQESRK